MKDNVILEEADEQTAAHARELIYSCFNREFGLVGIVPDRWDSTAIFLVGRSNSQVVAALRFIVDGSSGLPIDAYRDVCALRRKARLLGECSRLATDPAHRGGMLAVIAFRGMNFVRRVAAREGVSHLVIDAILSLVPLYQRFGFVPVDDPFLDESILRPGDDPRLPNAQVMMLELANHGRR